MTHSIFFRSYSKGTEIIESCRKTMFFFFLRGGWFKKVFCGVGKGVYFDSSVFLYRGLRTPVIWEKRNTIAMFVLRNFSHRASARIKKREKEGFWDRLKHLIVKRELLQCLYVHQYVGVLFVVCFFLGNFFLIFVSFLAFYLGSCRKKYKLFLLYISQANFLLRS